MIVKYSGNSTIHGNLDSTLDDYLTRVTDFGFSGTILVASNNQIILHKGYGFANALTGVHNTIQTVYDIGSISKQFTAAAILQLEERGFLTVDDPVSSFFDVPVDKSSITIHHLLTHTSGLPRFHGGDFDQYKQSEFTIGVLNSKLLAEPGKTFNYSNPGYSLLAMIIEQLSDQQYRDYIVKNVFIPANMTNVGWYGDKLWDDDRVAHAYTDNLDNGSPRTWPRPSWPHIGSGGVCMTTRDLFSWILALQGDNILAEESKKKMWTPFLDDYGYGWEIDNSSECGLVRSHDGASYLGFNSDLSWFVDRNVVTIIFCNRWIDRIYLADLMKIKLKKLIFGRTNDFHIPIGDFIQLDKNALQRYMGNYLLPSDAGITVSVISNQLMMSVTGQEIINLLVSSSRETSLLYDELTKKIEIAMNGIQEKNDLPFKDLFEYKNYSDEKFDGFLERLESFRDLDHLVDENRGKYNHYQVLGTTPIWWLETQCIASTAVKFHTENGIESYRIYWSEKGIVEINETFPMVFSVLLMPVNRKEFVGYHLGTSNTINVRFADSTSGSIDKLALLSGTTKLFLEKQ